MSDYNHIKALRYKPTDEEIKALCIEIEEWKKTKPEEAKKYCWITSNDWTEYLKEVKFPELFEKDYKNSMHKHFDIGFSDTNVRYLDLVLLDTYGKEYDDWYKARYTTLNEQEKYRKDFEEIFPSLDMSRVHLVDFCWYNCCEPDDCYEPSDDPFYKEV